MPGLLGLLRPGLKEFRHLRELILKDLFEFAASSADLQGYDACFFCLAFHRLAWLRPPTPA